jgi:hypothetical protein
MGIDMMLVTVSRTRPTCSLAVLRVEVRRRGVCPDHRHFGPAFHEKLCNARLSAPGIGCRPRYRREIIRRCSVAGQFVGCATPLLCG